MQQEQGEVRQQQLEQREEINVTEDVETIVRTETEQIQIDRENKDEKSEQDIQVLINSKREEEDFKKMTIELIKQTNDSKLMKLMQLSEYLDTFDDKDFPKDTTISQINTDSAQQINEYLDSIIAQNNKALEQCDELEHYLDSIQDQLLKSKQK